MVLNYIYLGQGVFFTVLLSCFGKLSFGARKRRTGERLFMHRKSAHDDFVIVLLFCFILFSFDFLWSLSGSKYVLFFSTFIKSLHDI